MSTTVDQAFIKQFESDVHMAYQRKGTKLRNTIRVKNNLKGTSTFFQKVTSGQASQKARHAQVATMNIVHSNVECILQDWYASDWIDKLDELRINIDERMIAAESGANALGRKTDDLITAAMDSTTNVQTEAGAVHLNLAKVNKVFTFFGDNDIPDDGDRYWAVSPSGWADLLQGLGNVTAGNQNFFSSADYVGSSDLPYIGMSAKRWMSFMWFQFSGLKKVGNIRTSWAWHRRAVGHAIGADVQTEINYVPLHVSFLATSLMSQGSVLIDATGVFETEYSEA